MFFYIANGHTSGKGGEKMSRVKCLVEECHYNDSNLCDASEIEVVSCGSSDVKRSDQTECRTFRTRGQGQS